MAKSSPLIPPATIAVVSPASGTPDPSGLQAGCQRLEAMGFSVQPPPHTPPYGYLAAPDSERIAHLNSVLKHDEITGLFCTRGGYGSLRLLEHIDYKAARNHPKLLVGYSDITALQCALFQHAGWKSILGSMVAVEWQKPNPRVEEQFWKMAAGTVFSPLLGPAGEPLQPFKEGQHEGVLIGGNLSLIVRLIGTPYLPPMKGALLYLEDVGEKPYRIDGLLAQLRLSGVLSELGGVILGSFTETSTERPSLSLPEIIEHYFSDAPYPVATGLRYGHYPDKTPMPFGIRARLEVDRVSAQLHMLEPVISTTPA